VFCLFYSQGDQLAIAKETGRRLGMGTNMYPSASLLGQDKDASIASLPVEELIEKADGFAGVFPGSHSLPVHPDDFLFTFFSSPGCYTLSSPPPIHSCRAQV